MYFFRYLGLAFFKSYFLFSIFKKKYDKIEKKCDDTCRGSMLLLNFFMPGCEYGEWI